jgi:putative transposase
VLPVGSPTYNDYLAKRVDLGKLSARAKPDLMLKPRSSGSAENFEVCGAQCLRQVLRRHCRCPLHGIG